MIAVDSSAFIAIVKGEPERALFVDRITRAERIVVSPATIIEARMVAYYRGGSELLAKLDSLFASFAIEIAPIESADIAAAHAAFVAYGKGTGHPAQLNFGDLFSYALAKTRGVPLLYKGDDFARTDIPAASA